MAKATTHKASRVLTQPLKPVSRTQIHQEDRSIPETAFHRHNSQYHAAIKYPIDQKHDGVAGVDIVSVQDIRLGPVGDHDAGQAEDTGPSSGSRVKPKRARDETERSSPRHREDQSPKDDSHVSTLTYSRYFPGTFERSTVIISAYLNANRKLAGGAGATEYRTTSIKLRLVSIRDSNLRRSTVFRFLDRSVCVLHFFFARITADENN